MITSAYSKSSNSSGFNPILQKFYKMICEIIVFKTVCGILLVFFVNRILLIILWRTIFRNCKITKSWISRDPFISKKFPRTVLKIVSVQISWTDFFSKSIFLRTWSFFHDWKTTNLGTISFHKKIILYFLQRWLFNFNILLKQTSEIHLENLRKNGGFILLNKPLKPYQLP